MPVRILQVVTQMNRAGLETMLMNYYRRMDRTRIQFDFLMHRQGPGDYDAEIATLGGRIFRLFPISPRTFPQYLQALESFFAKHPEYRVVHAHLDALSGFVLRAAKAAGVPVRIAHSHNNGFELEPKLPLRLLAKRLIPRYATHYWGCSPEALRFLFGSRLAQRGWILPNAIDLESFCFDPAVRGAVRRELSLEGRLVVGNVGRLCYQKNQGFLLKIFAQLQQRCPRALLLLVGDGKGRAALQEQARKLGIEAAVCWLGVRDDVARLLQAMDLFLLPSRFEGLGIVLLEAQMAGLRCLASDKVSREGDLTGQVTFHPLNDSPAGWARQALSLASQGRAQPAKQLFRAAGYDIALASRRLTEEYLRLWGDGG